jgi:hypothetical protein
MVPPMVMVSMVLSHHVLHRLMSYHLHPMLMEYHPRPCPHHHRHHHYPPQQHHVLVQLVSSHPQWLSNDHGLVTVLHHLHVSSSNGVLNHPSTPSL